ncbi:BLUF domain-containing protein [Undibacterium rugosum]|uniref:BLUF domain-containing protein n=1 Tax=Undibacterium rugosum TaxID=2762291 RepID=A0A923I0H2_9BURK|nr:BLUF domain-containing protein [Undibacterium rugosum]MBC3934197.1 BLUF domain-containing protein [Undibacterium rugosum]MBR7779660.1 BLUF domain-containing protein [Undibacterium rugosum]
MLVRLLYASRPTETSPCDLVQSILQASRSHNPAHGITGVLCHTEQVFIQVLEGGREAVNALYGQILKDTRHKDVMLLDYEEIQERRYPSWTMGQANMARINPSTVLKYSPLPVLDPYTMSGKMLLSLIDELMATASIVGRT